MLNFHKLKSGIPVDALLEQIKSKAYLWDQLTQRQDYPGSPHKDTQSIVVRWAKSQTPEAVFTEIKAVDYPAYGELDLLSPIVNRCMDAAQSSELGRILITRLKPMGHILLHADEGAYADHYERFHLCLKSEPGNVFLSEIIDSCGEYVYMRPGEFWNFNHKAPHTVSNYSKTDRLHIILDMVAPIYRRERV